jgi:membrane protein
MSAPKRALTAVDEFQQRHPVLALPIAVWKKFNNDQAGYLAALISYYGFAAIFPLLLVLVTVLNIALKNDASLRASLLNSALAQYPIVGTQIRGQLGSVGGSGVALVIGVILLFLGARGVASAMQNALCGVWEIDKKDRPSFLLKQLWGLLLMLDIGIGFCVTTFLSGLAGGTGHILTGAGAHIGAVVVSLALNVAVFWIGFRLATMHRVPWLDLWIGATAAAVVWQVLQVAGGYVISHELQKSSQLYGTFGVVLGLMAWLYLQAELTLYAAEIDVVLVRRQWPRSLLPDAAGDNKPEADSKAERDDKAGTTA